MINKKNDSKTKLSLNKYHDFFVIFGSLLITLIIYFQTLESLIARWLKFDEGYGHGFLLLGVVAWLFFELRNERAPASTKLNFASFLILIPSLLLWFVGKISGIIIFEQLSLPLFWWSSIWFLAGLPFARSVLFPVAFTYFAIPFWDHLNSFLVNSSVYIETILLSLTKLPVLVEGNRFSIPSGVISIADGCSGLRYLIIGLAFGTLACRLYFTSIKKRFFIMSLSLLLSLMANWVRIFILILIGYFTEMQSSLMNDHEYFGFFVFGIMLLPIFFAVRFYSEPVASTPKKQRPTNLKTLFIGFPVITAVLISAPMVIQYLMSQTSKSGKISFNQLSGEELNFQSLPTPILQGKEQAIQSKTWLYKNEQNIIYIQADWYKQQQLGDDFLPYSHIFNKKNWLVDKREQKIEKPPILELELRNKADGSKWRAFYWIYVGDYQTSNTYIAKLAEIPTLLFGRNDAMVISMFASCSWQDCSDINLEMHSLLQNELPLIEQLSGHKK